jgi:hypothetical protein
MSKMGGVAYDEMYGPVVAECRTCSGTGEVYGLHDCMKGCNVCKGIGEVQCDNGGLKCPFDGYCYCEAAWERRQDDLASGEY